MEEGVYRSAKMVPGMVTYFAVDWTGDIIDDLIVAVRPGAVKEAHVASRLRQILRERNDEAGRPALRLTSSSLPVSLPASPLASTPIALRVL